MVDKSQLLKGTLEGCILKIIACKETYGYEIAGKLEESGLGEFKEGTLYPLLLRLEKKGLIKAAFRPSALGPKRKYYHLTEQGREYLEEFIELWQCIEDSVHAILEGEESV